MDNFVSRVQTDTISNIIQANTIVQDSDNNIETSPETVSTILLNLISNPNKALDVLVSLFKYAVRNGKVAMLPTIFTETELMIDNINNIAVAERYINYIPALIKYSQTFSNLTPIKDNDMQYIYNELSSIQNKLLQIKSDLSGINDDEPTPLEDVKFAAVVSSMFEVVEECSRDIKIYEMMYLDESAKDSIRRAGDAVAKKVVMFSVADRNLSNRINDKFNKFMNEYREDKKNASYETIVKQSLDLSRMLKQIISSSIVAFLVPGSGMVKLFGGALTLLVLFSKNKKTDNKYKGVVVNDLKFELRVVQEKIKDAEGKNDNQAKYKLMRIENQISRAIDRINYGLSAEQH